MRQKLVIALLVLLSVFTQVQLDGFISKVKNKVNQKVNQRVDNKVDKAIDKTLDEIEGKNTQSPSSVTGNAEAASAKNEDGVKSFSKYEFIPGEKILYAEDFAQEAVGELHIGWNTNGICEVVMLENISGKWLRLQNPFIYLTNNTKELTGKYTAEFDIILQLKNNGWIYPTFFTDFFLLMVNRVLTIFF
jgi:hypothetical protein